MRKFIYVLFAIFMFLAVYAAEEAGNTVNVITTEKVVDTTANTVAMTARGNMIVNEPEVAPLNLKAKVEGMSVKLSWQKKSNKAIYDIYRSDNQADNYIKINKEDVRGNAYTDNAVNSIISPLSNIDYFYKVSALIDGKERGDSNVVTAKPRGKLMPPTNITAKPDLSDVHLSWVAPNSTGDKQLKGYGIYRSVSRGVKGERINKDVVEVYEYLDTGLTPGTVYYYTFNSVDVDENVSNDSKVITAIPFTRASKPVGLTATAVSSESIKLSWAEPEASGTYGISGYNIYRSNNPSTFPEPPINMGLAKPYKDASGRAYYYDNMILSTSAPIPGERYYYKVISVDAAGNTGGASEIGSAQIEIISIPTSGILSADISQYGLPPESKLQVSGRKSVKIGGNIVVYEENDQVPVSEQPFDFTQTFRVKLKGNIGKNILVDVDYDDQNPEDEYTKISIKYQGEKGDALQELSFGDISLNLPPTRYASYSQTLFGIKAEAELGDKFSITAIGAQTKGITDVQTFTGKLRTKETNGRPGFSITDTSFSRNIYFYITKDPSQVSELSANAGLPEPAVPITIKPGSVVVYVADHNALADDATTIYSSNKSFNFKPRYLGTDYTVDYQTGIIKFNYYIADTYSVAVAYETSAGERVGYDGTAFDLNEANLNSNPDGYTSNSGHLIQDGRLSSQGDLSHKVLNYYYLGETQIENPANDKSFIIKIQENGVDVPNPIPLPWENNADLYYDIDTDLGLLKFKSFYPFSGSAPADPSNNIRNSSDDDAYRISSPVSKYAIYLEYQYYVSSYRLDHFPVVFGSERVFLNGRILKKDVDYYIFYETGEITFVDQNLIQPSTEVKIAYEYFPFFQTFQNTVVGARAEYKLFDNLSIGSTFLYKWSNSGITVPDARSTETSLSTPASMFLADGDIKYDLSKEQMNAIISAVPFVDKTDIPVDFKFHGEVAYSGFNPNTFEKVALKEKGVAMIDNMEGADNSLGASVEKEAWFPASIPAGLSTDSRVYVGKDEVSEESDIPTVVTSGQQFTPSEVTKLKLTCNNLTDENWDAFRYVLSTYGENLNLYNYLEMQVSYETTGPINMIVDVGIISEDSNGNGIFGYNDGGIKRDSEDDDSNGVLGTEEDSGISGGIYPSNPGYWGSGNNHLDTEDMNINGQLDTSEAYYEFSPDGSVYPQSELQFSGTGIRTIRIPLSEFSQAYGVERNPNLSDFFAIIKHLRIGVKGTSAAPSSGTIKIEKIEFTGNSWRLKTLSASSDLAGNSINSPDTSKFKIETVSQNTLPEYIPNTDYFDFQDDDDKKAEEGLQMSYNLSSFDNRGDGKPIYYATKVLSNTIGYDYQTYNKLKMDVLYSKRSGNASPGGVLFIRLGSDANDELNYYQYNHQLDDIAADNTWQTIEFQIDGSDKKRSTSVGTPNLRRVRYITVGVINPNNIDADEIIYLNNIRISDPDDKAGIARYANSALNFSGIGTLTHTYEEKDTGFVEFTKMEKANYEQHYIENKARFDYTQLSFLPSWVEASNVRRYVEEEYKGDTSYTGSFAWADTVTERVSGSSTLNSIPGLSLSYNGSWNNTGYVYFPQYAHQNNFRKTITHSPNARYMAPSEIQLGDAIKIPLGSNTFESRITVIDSETDYNVDSEEAPTASTTWYDQWNNKIEQIHSWTGSYTFDNITISPYYKYALIEEKGNLTSTFNFYADAIGEKNYVERLLVMKRDINPKLTVTFGEFGIFTPSVTYNSSQRTEYTLNQLYSSGSLNVSTAVNLSKLMPMLPNITSLSVNVSDSNRRYDNGTFKDTFVRYFDEESEGDKPLTYTMDFMDRWYLNIWKYLIDEKEITRLESVSSNGSLRKNYSVKFSDITIFEKLKIAPGVSYDRTRSSTTRMISSLDDKFSIYASNISISGVTIPFLEGLVKDQVLSGHYRYGQQSTYNATIYFNEDGKEVPISGTVLHDSSIRLNYDVKNGVKGTLSSGMTANQTDYYILGTDEIEKSITSLSFSPSFTINYSWKIEQPITVWGWVPFIGGKVFKFQNNLDLQGVLSALIISGGGDDLSKRQNQVYNANFSVSYNFLNNIRSRLNLRYKINNDDELPNKDYQTFGFDVEVVAEF